MTTPISSTTPTPVADVVGMPRDAHQQTAPGELGKDAFLKLLIAQLRYQDPSSPMDSSSFIAQTSQLTSVEKLTELAAISRDAFAVQQRLGAASLVGRSVTWTADDGSTLSGVVDAVNLSATTALLRIASTTVPLDRVTEVTSKPTTG